MRVFAIAARAVCALPDNLETVTGRLALLTAKLVVPEVTAANECTRLWNLFARVATVPKPALRVEAARAFCRDLDALGQRLDLPPLADWDDIPQAIDDPGANELDSSPTLTHEPITLEVVRERARGIKGAAAGPRFPAPEASRLLSALGLDERKKLFDTLVGKGILGRSEVNLLIRHGVKGGEVAGNETMLIEVLERLGGWFASQ